MTPLRRWTLFGSLSIASLAQHAYYWPQIPARVATHFGADGTADGWMPKLEATLLLVGIQIGVPFFILLVSHFAYQLPNEWQNLPHKEYWLAPERRQMTLARQNSMIEWIVFLTVAFIAMVVHLTFIANREEAPLNITLFLPLLLSYLVAIAILTLRNYFQLLKIPKA